MIRITNSHFPYQFTREGSAQKLFDIYVTNQLFERVKSQKSRNNALGVVPCLQTVQAEAEIFFVRIDCRLIFLRISNYFLSALRFKNKWQSFIIVYFLCKTNKAEFDMF